MSNVTTDKFITVDHLKRIREYIDCADTVAFNDTKDYIKSEIDKIIEELGSEISSNSDRLDVIEYKLDNGISDDSASLANIIFSLRDKVQELDKSEIEKSKVIESLNKQLSSLQSDHNDLYDNVHSGMIFDEDEIKEILDTALIEKTTITDDMVETPNLYATNVVALVGKFGKIKASNIQGNKIEGKTVQSTDGFTLKEGTPVTKFDGDVATGTVTANGSTTGPSWQLNADGSGYLGKGGIYWTKDGNIKMNGVTMSWGDIDGAPDIPTLDDVNLEPSKFKSMVFRRGDDFSTAKLTGGSWSNPVPTDTNWSDGIPAGTGKLWMSYKVFKSDDTSDGDWSTPTIMVDTESFEVAYATIEAENAESISAGLPKDDDGNAKPNADGSFTFTNGWSDEPVTDGSLEYIYMATASCDNGKWSGWTVSKIKGEKGEDGTSIKITRSFDTLEDFRNTIPQDVAPEDLSTSYVVAGDLYVWNGSKWENVGKFKGDPGKDGDTYYLHIKYAKNINIEYVDDTGTVTNSAGIELTNKNGEDTTYAKWIGVGHSIESTDPDPLSNLAIYKWTRLVTEADPTSYKSIAFTRVAANVDLSNHTPKGGDYINPIPNNSNGITWYDGIPDGEGVIWSTYKVFVSNESYDSNTTWSKPTKMIDEPGKFETAYGIAGVCVDGEIDESGLPVDENGYANPNGTFSNGWYDEPEEANGDEIVYMATTSYANGNWSPWHILKIKGEKGDKGGSVKLSTAFNTVEDLVGFYDDEGVHGVNGEPNDEYKDNAHIVKYGESKNGTWENHLFVWIGTDRNDNSTTDDDYFYKGWYDSGQFNGKDGKDGIDGVSMFRSTVFMRSNITPNTPTGGNWNNPKPTVTAADGTLLWSDGIPSGAEILWASTATFSSDKPNEAVWSEPAQMTDTSEFEVIYGIADADLTNLPSLPVTEGFENIYGWYDDAIEDAVYMATASCRNGDWSDWTISKIKGEDGISAYIHIKYAKSITFDSNGNAIDGECTENGGENNVGATFIGICNSDSDIDPVIDKTAAGYDSSNWSLYKWSNISIDEELINRAIETEISKYNISSNHISGRTFDSAENVNLANGTKVEIFEKTDGVENGKSSISTPAQGPAWQIRKDGDGYLAAGKISWDNDGLYIDGTSIMDGIKHDEYASQELDTLIASKITAKEITTEILKTHPNDDSADRIHIEDNFIQCINNDGTRSLRISSDDIDFNKANAAWTLAQGTSDSGIFVTIPTSHVGNGYYRNNISVLSGQGIGTVSDTDTINTSKKCVPIGTFTMNDDAISRTHILRVGARISLSTTGGENINTGNYSINTGTAASTLFTNSVWSNKIARSETSGGYLLVYKLNGSTYAPYKVYGFDVQWGASNSFDVTSDSNYGSTDASRAITAPDVFIPDAGGLGGGEVIITSAPFYTIYTEIYITEPGDYAVQVLFEPKSITTDKSDTIRLNAMISTTSSLYQPLNYTEICKDGLMSFNQYNSLKLNAAGVVLESTAINALNNKKEDGNYTLKVNTQGISATSKNNSFELTTDAIVIKHYTTSTLLNNKFYGLKINTNGIYISNYSDDSGWTRLDLTRLLTNYTG